MRGVAEAVQGAADAYAHPDPASRTAERGEITLAEGAPALDGLQHARVADT
jgi:hypothetical protein